ncbi:hypothetical protein [Streptomyces sp. A012304]|uniref:hypothetical protein n=1 Tax=Streptomyces sp. A012304 TaxID=375446 RepID=UPI002230B1DD|nr:hypothetical protein [Streptomyces sp. A012304]GKQ36566.1 hypothetical protein ALMP_31070 [Streptomyces sp. A012304]
MKKGQPQVIWRRLNIGAGADRRRRQRLILGMGVVTALVAAIALAAGHSGDNSADDAKPPAAATPHSRAGAQSTAAKIASAMGSERMFSTEARHDLLDSIAEPNRRAEMIRAYDAQYVPFTKRLGLDTAGRPPLGAEFVSRAMPAGVAVRSYTGNTASVAVWCSTLFGLTGNTVPEEIPVESGWLTMTVNLRWIGGEWRMTDVQQTDGPKPGDPGADQFATVPQL